MRVRPPRFSVSRLIRWLLMLLPLLSAARLGAMAFTYQGRLVDSGVLANGNYELRFRLFDQLAGGNQVNGDVSLPSVTVTNGLFTVQLEFGAGAFNGEARWLELAARPAGSADPLEVFDPRQPVTAAPYALYALAGSGDAATLTTGTLPDARLSVNIARTADLLSISNSLSVRLENTNAALAARLDELTTALLTISNQFKTLLLPGITVASTDAADSVLTAQGLVEVLKFDATGWKNGAVSFAPAPRVGSTAVWGGQSMLVWGGTIGGGTPSATGAGYDPGVDQWSPLSTVNPPTARSGHTAVWTGTQMLIWGGFGSGYLGTGSAYSPANLNWVVLPTAGAPDGRDGHNAVWTGARMLIWGGRNGNGLLADGAEFDPSGGTWTALPALNAPEARRRATAVWAGDRLIIFGGEGGGGDLGSGAMLPFTGGATAGAWQPLASSGAPTSRSGHSAVWTGSKMIIWGGANGGSPLGDGAEFNPANNSWAALPATGAPSARFGHVAVWTGSEMLIFGGEDATGAIASGGAYNPVTGHWRPLSGAGSPVARSGGLGVWSGSELLVFGGQSAGAPLAALQRLNPQPTWYLYRKP